MRKMLILFAAIALLCIAVAPIFAQDIALLDVANDTDELSTFVSLVESSNLMNSLSRGGNFTMFAPSNAAWEALPARLGMSMDELVANPALLRQILRYHIVAQPYTVADLSTQLDAEGHSFLRTIEGSQILVTGNANGLFLNENLLLQDTGASFVSSDLAASNGILHVIDTVLLPPTDVIEAGQFRIAQLMPDVQLADVYINGELSAIEPLAYSDVSGWVEIPVGQYEIAFVPAGGSYEQMLMSPITVVIESEEWLTIAATGSVEEANLETQVVTEDLDRIVFDDTAQLTVLFDVAETTAVNVLANDEIIITNLLVDEAVGNSTSLNMPAGVYTLQFVTADESQQLILSFEITLQADTASLVTVTGSQESPEYFVEVTDMAELDEIVRISLPPAVGR